MQIQTCRIPRQVPYLPTQYAHTATFNSSEESVPICQGLHMPILSFSGSTTWKKPPGTNELPSAPDSVLQNLLMFLTMYLWSFTIGRQHWVLVVAPRLPKGESLRWTHWKKRWTHTFFQSLHTISPSDSGIPGIQHCCCLCYLGNALSIGLTYHF